MREIKKDLETYRYSLQSFHTKTATIFSDESILDVIQIKQVQDFADICQLLGLGVMLGLSEKGRELESLPNSCSSVVEIHLLRKS